jgi:hypothetical protein
MYKQFRFVFGAGIAASALAMSGMANASSSTCEIAVSSYSSYAAYPIYQSELLSQHPECFAGGSTTSTTQINATTFTQASAISRAISSRLRLAGPGPFASADARTGLAAGEAQPWNVWVSYNGNDSRISYTNVAATRTRSDTDVDTTVLGGDYALSPKTALGVSLGIDRGNGSGQSGAFAPTTTGTKGYTIAPYIGYQLSKVWALDASAGWGESEFSSGSIRADAKRWYATGNLAYARWVNNWQFTGKLSYLHGEEKYEDSKNNGATLTGTASKNELDQARLGAQAGYWMNGVMPYAGLLYVSDIHRSSSNGGGVDPLGRNAWVLSIGVNFFSLTSKVTGGIAYEQENGRTNSKNETLMANINFRF